MPFSSIADAVESCVELNVADGPRVSEMAQLQLIAWRNRILSAKFQWALYS